MNGDDWLLVSMLAGMLGLGVKWLIDEVKYQIDCRRRLTPAQRRMIMDGEPRGFEVRRP